MPIAPIQSAIQTAKGHAQETSCELAKHKQGIYCTHKLQHFVAIQVASHSSLVWVFACHTLSLLAQFRFSWRKSNFLNKCRLEIRIFMDLYMSLQIKFKKAEDPCGIMVHNETSHTLKKWEMASCSLFFPSSSESHGTSKVDQGKSTTINPKVFKIDASSCTHTLNSHKISPVLVLFLGVAFVWYFGPPGVCWRVTSNCFKPRAGRFNQPLLGEDFLPVLICAPGALPPPYMVARSSSAARIPAPPWVLSEWFCATPNKKVA